MNDYFLLLGADFRSIVDLKETLEQTLNILFEYRNSRYLGSYYLYKGEKADRFTIEYNFFDGEYKFQEFSEYQFLLRVGMIKGTEKSKLSKLKIYEDLEKRDVRFILLKNNKIKKKL